MTQVHELDPTSPATKQAPPMRRRLGRARRGFTLIEAALVTVIVGFGVMSMVELLAAGTVINVEGAQLTTAINLAKQIREMTIQQTFDETRAMHGSRFDPPLDATGSRMTDLAGWEQRVEIRAADPEQLVATYASENPTAVKVTVVVTRRQEPVTEVSWYRFK